MANREALLDQVRRAYAARGKGALDDLMTEFHPEAVFTLVGDKQALSVTGSVQGHSAVREHKTEVLDLFRFQNGKIIELIEFADTGLIGKMMS
jgi:ketosteroid isomerase-like protein